MLLNHPAAFLWRSGTCTLKKTPKHYLTRLSWPFISKPQHRAWHMSDIRYPVEKWITTCRRGRSQAALLLEARPCPTSAEWSSHRCGPRDERKQGCPSSVLPKWGLPCVHAHNACVDRERHTWRHMWRWHGCKDRAVRLWCAGATREGQDVMWQVTTGKQATQTLWEPQMSLYWAWTLGLDTVRKVTAKAWDWLTASARAGRRWACHFYRLHKTAWTPTRPLKMNRYTF